MIEPPAEDVAPDRVALSKTGPGLGREADEGEAEVVADGLALPTIRVSPPAPQLVVKPLLFPSPE